MERCVTLSNIHDRVTYLIYYPYTRYLSSCLFVGCTLSPRSHSYLCSRGFAPLPPRSISKSIGYMLFVLVIQYGVNIG
ncbi:hypothetical protein EIL81_11260 [Photorhabdus laumondii subsp. laumondii]|nr:hypothetical protein [Photorhabdus laumondii subsp. laumondii]